MCPECFATIALLVAGVVSTGGVTATVKLLRHKKKVAQISEARKPSTNHKEKSE